MTLVTTLFEYAVDVRRISRDGACFDLGEVVSPEAGCVNLGGSSDVSGSIL
jgi:hypothetical protein